MKTSVVLDFDSRRKLFGNLVEALPIQSIVKKWDLSWGEPFLAVSQDRRVWVRIFYEESLPVSAERLRHEAERLIPLIPAGGLLCICLPHHIGQGISYQPTENTVSVRVWLYDNDAPQGVALFEEKEEAVGVLSSPVSPSVRSPEITEERLTSDEVRELAEIGLALTRYRLKSV